MTIPENIRDVALKMTNSLPPWGLVVILILVVNDVLEYYLGIERIHGVVDLVQACTVVLARSTP